MDEDNETPKGELNTGTPALGDTLWLPCQVSFELKILGFTVGDLIQLEAGSVVDSGQNQGADIEAALNGHHFGWAEAEAAGDRLRFRLKDLVS